MNFESPSSTNVPPNSPHAKRRKQSHRHDEENSSGTASHAPEELDGEEATTGLLSPSSLPLPLPLPSLPSPPSSSPQSTASTSSAPPTTSTGSSLRRSTRKRPAKSTHPPMDENTSASQKSSQRLRRNQSSDETSGSSTKWPTPPQSLRTRSMTAIQGMRIVRASIPRASFPATSLTIPALPKKKSSNSASLSSPKPSSSSKSSTQAGAKASSSAPASPPLASIPSTASDELSSLTNLKQMKELDENFQPGAGDVICGRGKIIRQHIGNQKFRTIIHEIASSRYSSTIGRSEKSTLISQIVQSVREASPNGGFVKCIDHRWYEVGDYLAREKVGQCLRDLLHRQYRSSTKSKRKKRLKSTSDFLDEFEALVLKNGYIKQRLDELSQFALTRGKEMEPEDLLQHMTLANGDVLCAIKKDEELSKLAIEMTES